MPSKKQIAVSLVIALVAVALVSRVPAVRRIVQGA